MSTRTVLNQIEYLILFPIGTFTFKMKSIIYTFFTHCVHKIVKCYTEGSNSSSIFYFKEVKEEEKC